MGGKPSQPGPPHAIVVSPNPPDSPGGVERSASLVRDILKRQGWRVSIVWPDGESSRLAYVTGFGPMWTSLAAAAAARAAGPAQLIVTNGFLGVGFPHGVPRVHVYHGTLVCDSLAVRGAIPRRELVRRVAGGGSVEALCARGATVVSVSSSAAEEVRRFYHVTTDLVMPNPVDTTVFRPMVRADARAHLGLPAERRLALFVGRADHRKGSHLVAGATRRAGYELVVAGAANVDGARYLGVLAPRELALAYNAADCVVLPSGYEGCSFVVLEALACGVPLITTRVGWMRDLLREHPDYDALCVRAEESEIADRLERLDALARPDLIDRVQRTVADDHNLSVYAEQWADLVRGVLRRR